METINSIHSFPCKIRKGYRYVIIDASSMIIYFADFKTLDDALIDLGKSIHFFRIVKGVPIIREELYYISDFRVSTLKKTYHY